MRFLRLPLAALLVLLSGFAFADPAAAQATDSVTIEVLSPPSSISIVAPETAYRGDTITVLYEIVDADGAPTEGIATWAVNPEDRATILEQTDSTVSVVLERAGFVSLVVTVERVDRIVIGGRYLVPGGVRPGTDSPIPAGTFQWETQGAFLVVENTPDALALCAVGVSGETALFASDAACAENLVTLTGVVQPLDTDLLRRAEIERDFGVPSVILRPDLFKMRIDS